MAELAVLVPVLARPHRVRPLLESIWETTPDAETVFLYSPGDEAETRALVDAGVQFYRPAHIAPVAFAVEVEGGYAQKVNAGVALTEAPLIFAGADDLDLRPGWLEAARARLTDGVEVVGVNDLIPRGREHATHFLMTREYAERPTIDGEQGPFSTAYAHWYVDNELIETAKARGAYAYAEDAHVEHLHPLVSKAPLDCTYELGNAHAAEDRTIFTRRRRLWA